jgi:uncharacterized C2H2 Zn-finger protein
MTGFFCSSCSAQLNSKTGLDNHRRNVHQSSVNVKYLNGMQVIKRNDENVFQCPFCLSSFKSSASIRRHAKNCGSMNDRGKN